MSASVLRSISMRSPQIDTSPASTSACTHRALALPRDVPTSRRPMHLPAFRSPTAALPEPATPSLRPQAHARRHTAARNASRGCAPAVAARGDGLSAASDPDDLSLDAVGRAATALYRFSRPHTMLGTTISVVSISLLALQGRAITSVAMSAMGTALVAALLMNISIVGINQIFDVEIDKVNKPELPMASGELSMSAAIAIVAVCTGISLLVGWMSGSPALMFTLSVSLALGVVYSTDLPFMRWKRSPLLAATCILAVRALIVQLGFFYHIKFAVGATQLVMTPPLVFTVAFMFFFSIVIALFKDIPDVKGDEQADVRTLSVRLGVPRVFWICIGLLTTAYACAIAFQLWAYTTLASGGAGAGGLLGAAVGASGSTGLGEALGGALGGGAGGVLRARCAMAVANVVGHAVLASALWRRALRVQLGRKQEITSFYMFVWKLFYAEYLLIPLLQA